MLYERPKDNGPPPLLRMKPDSRREFVVQKSRMATESSNPNIFSSQVALSPGPEVLGNGRRSRAGDGRSFTLVGGPAPAEKETGAESSNRTVPLNSNRVPATISVLHENLMDDPRG